MGSPALPISTTLSANGLHHLPTHPSPSPISSQGGLEEQEEEEEDIVDSSDVLIGSLDDGRTKRKSAKYTGVKYGYEQEFSDEEAVELAKKTVQMSFQVNHFSQKPYIEQFVGRRINPKTGDVEYRAKFQGRSHLHLPWLTYPEAELFVGDGYNRLRIQKYERKLLREEYGELDNVDDLDISNTVVDKILSHKISTVRKLQDDIKEFIDDLVDEVYPRVTCHFLIQNRQQVYIRLKGILTKLYQDPTSEIFHNPVDPDEVPNYLDHIDSPMDFGTIMARFLKDYYIGAVGHLIFASDIRLVFQNCKEFNEEGSSIWQTADYLSGFFERYFKEWILCPSAWMIPLEGWQPWLNKCSVCQDEGNEEEMLLCDLCDGGFHLSCLKPAIKKIPDGVWHCHYCVKRKEYINNEMKQSPQKSFKKECLSPRSSNLKSEEDIPKIIYEKKEKEIEDVFRNSSTNQTLFLVKWQNLSYNYCTWETANDLGDDEKIEIYYKFNKVPSQQELINSTCQLPCCANLIRHQNQTQYQNCTKDKFCILGLNHAGDCSRNYLPAENGTMEFTRQRMIDQLRAQMLSYYMLMNNQTPTNDLLKLCGMYSTAYTYKLQQDPHFIHKNEDEYIALDESSSDEEDDDENINQKRSMFSFSSSINMSQSIKKQSEEEEVDEDDEMMDESDCLRLHGDNEKNDILVMECMSAMVEHIALAKKLPSLEPQIIKETACEYSVFLQRSPFGLGLTLGLSEEGQAIVMPFQLLANGMMGPAQSCQLIRPGDIIVGVNNQTTLGLPFVRVIEILASSTGYIMLRLRTERKVFMLPAISDPVKVVINEQNELKNEYLPYPYLSNHPSNPSFPLLIGCSPPALEIKKIKHPVFYEKIQAEAPNGPMQFIFESIRENSVDLYEHFCGILPTLNPSKKNMMIINEEEDEKEKETSSLKMIARKKKDYDDEFIPYEKSPLFKGGRTLRSYQVDGLNWLITCYKTRRSCILADEMGLGKTVQIVSFMEHLKSEESIRGPFLIIVPLSTIQHWRREIEDWTDLNVCVYHDIGDKCSKVTSKEIRNFIRAQEWYYPNQPTGLLKFNILLTTYETLIADFEQVESIHWRCVVIDEAQRLKNTKSRLLKKMRLMHVDRKFLLTGTPLQNNVHELGVLLNFIDPIKFESLDEFQQKFGVLDSQEQVLSLQKLISPYILRRVKEDVEKSIPPKEETIIEVELTTFQKVYYRAIYERNQSVLYLGVKGGLPSMNNIHIQLRKCCNHPFLIKGVIERELNKVPNATKDEIMKTTIESSGKFVLVNKLLPKLKREGHKVLIFSQFLKTLDLLEQLCEYHGYGVERLDGSTIGSSRQASIDRFSKADSKTFVFLLSTRAGGVGINLIAADTVIIFDSDWNPQNDVQAQSRCHRIGQTKAVQIYRLITRNSFESEMFERASRKLGLEHAILGTASFSESCNFVKPSASQLEELLKRGAYHLTNEDDKASQQFVERDIEDILKENTHTRIIVNKVGKERKTGINFDRSSFVADSCDGTIDVEDPNFWEKVLPGAMTIEMLSLKLQDGSVLESRQSKTKFLKNLQCAIDKVLNPIDGSHVSQQAEYDQAICLLHKITLMKLMFSESQLKQMQIVLDLLENARVRSCRLEKKSSLLIQDHHQYNNNNNNNSIENNNNQQQRKQKRKKNNNTTKRNKFSFFNEQDEDDETTCYETGQDADICALCGEGGMILCCDGPCHRSFHLECVGMKSEPTKATWMCNDCTSGKHMCLHCGIVSKVGIEGGVFQCSVSQCGRFYHQQCLKNISKVNWLGKKRFQCPQHFCFRCTKKSKKKRLVTCTHCPKAFHVHCLQQDEKYLKLSKKSLICSDHMNDLINRKIDLLSSRFTDDEQDEQKQINTSFENKKRRRGRPRKRIDDDDDDDDDNEEDEEENEEENADMDEGEDEDDEYADENRKRKRRKEKGKRNTKRRQEESLEAKKCVLCGTIDKENNVIMDEDIEGDFIPYKISIAYPGKGSERHWIHYNCAVRCPEVYMDQEGELVNIPKAIKRGKLLRCSNCKQKGATIGCVEKNCKKNYHLRCALYTKGKFMTHEGIDHCFFCYEHVLEKEKIKQQKNEINLKINVKQKMESRGRQLKTPKTITQSSSLIQNKRLRKKPSHLNQDEIDASDPQISPSKKNTRSRRSYPLNKKVTNNDSSSDNEYQEEEEEEENENEQEKKKINTRRRSIRRKSHGI